METDPTSIDGTAPVAVVTGGSRGLGRALAAALVARGWHVLVDGRDAERLARATTTIVGPGRLHPLAGDVTDPNHRADLVAAVASAGRLDLLVNNASALGPSPQPLLVDYPLAELERVYAVNVLAPLAVAQALLPYLERSGGRLVDVSSDAAVEAYEGWGGYGSSKAALDQLTAVLAAEHPGIRCYAVDPGDMATDLHQQAVPGEDISHLPSPESVVPAVLRLLTGDLPSGRYRLADLDAAGAA